MLDAVPKTSIDGVSLWLLGFASLQRCTVFLPAVGYGRSLDYFEPDINVCKRPELMDTTLFSAMAQIIQMQAISAVFRLFHATCFSDGDQSTPWLAARFRTIRWRRWFDGLPTCCVLEPS